MPPKYKKIPSRHTLTGGYRVVKSVSGTDPIRKLPLPDAMDRLKLGTASIPFPPDVKSLDLKYYRQNSHRGILEFIAQHAPEIAWANPDLPFNFTRLGKPVFHRKPKRDGSVPFSPHTPTPKPASTPASTSASASTSTSTEATSEGSGATASAEGKADKRLIIHVKEDGTELRKGDKIPAQLIIHFHSKPTETLTFVAERQSAILEKLLRTVDVEIPEKLLQPEQVPRIGAPAAEATPQVVETPTPQAEQAVPA